jgi:hypothetical protein
MIRKLATSVAVAALAVTLGATPADAKPKPAKCKTISVTQTLLNTNGQPDPNRVDPGFWLIETTQKCRGKLRVTSQLVPIP